MKLQMGQATSLYLCVARGITGCFARRRVSVSVLLSFRNGFQEMIEVRLVVR